MADGAEVAGSASAAAPAVAPMGHFRCRPVTCFEKINRIGEGTYGTVYRARDKETGRIVALKKLHMKKEKGGFPLTSVREIKLLKITNHPNIVSLLEVTVGKKPDSIFLVFEYCEHDFAGLLDRIARPFSEAEIKTLLLQLLSAVDYLHKRFIIHRDLKLSNLLLNNKGVLKLADFGLARKFSNPLQEYTPKVVTLWYRCPEILLGCNKYHTAIDMWAVGCIFGELLKHKPLLPGNTDLKQLELITKLLGTPNQRIWPGFHRLEKASMIKQFAVHEYNELDSHFPKLSTHGMTLLKGLLTYDPSKRMTAEKALDHPYFTEPPLPASMMPTFPSQHTSAAEKSGGSSKLKIARHSNFGQVFDFGSSKKRKL